MKKQLLTFFGLTYLISWLIWLPLYGHTFGLTRLPAIPYNHALGALGPLLGSILATWMFLKKDGLKDLLRKCIQTKPIGYLAIAAFSPFLLATIASVINYFVNGNPIMLSGFLRTKEFPGMTFLAFFIYNLLFFGFGEEVGWRAFALPRFQTKLNALTASIVMTFFWALWHWPLFLYRPGYVTMDFAGILGWFFSLLTGSILLTWLYNSSRASILICAVFHSTIDIAFTGDLADKSTINYMGFLITVWGLLIVIIFKPRNLASNPKIVAVEAATKSSRE